MRYIDKYKECVGCPVQKYCGTQCMSIRLCNSYKEVNQNEDVKDNKEDRKVPATVGNYPFFDNPPVWG